MADVLVIDAEQPFAGEVKGNLEGRGFTVTQLDDGKEGLEHARGNKPDLIVLCVELPKMSGYSICNKLKKDSELKQIPLIITSSEATPETFAQHKKLKTRAEDYLIKPFGVDALIEKIGGHIELPSSSPPAPPPDDDDLGDALGALDEIGDDEVQLDDALDELKVESSEAEPEQVDALPDEESLDLGDLGEGADMLAGFEDGGGEEEDLLAGLGDGGEDLLAGLDDGGDDPLAGLGDDDVDGLGVLDDNPLGDGVLPDLDDAFDEIAPEAAPAKADEAEPKADEAEPKADEAEPKADEEGTAPEGAPPAAAPSMASAGSAADLQAMNAMRRENTELKASVGELEARLKGAEEKAKNAKSDLDSAKSGSSSSARETLELKKEIRNKEKELMTLKDEVFQKEEAVVDLQEELDRVKNASDDAVAGAADKDANIAKLEAKTQALTEERDALEAQIGDRLASAEAENNDLKGQVSSLQAEVTEARSQLDGKVKALEQENEETGQQLVDAYGRIKSEEGLREKAKDALNIALALLSGEVDSGDDAGGGVSLDA